MASGELKPSWEGGTWGRGVLPEQEMWTELKSGSRSLRSHSGTVYLSHRLDSE